VLIWPDGTWAHAAVTQSAGGWLDLSIGFSPDRRGRVSGLFGNFDAAPGNDLTTREGAVIQSDENSRLYGEFADSWRGKAADSLFDYTSGQNPESFTDRDFPHEYHSMADFGPDERESAEATCRDAGVIGPMFLADCVFDIGATGEVAFAGGAAWSEIATGNSWTPQLATSGPGGVGNEVRPGAGIETTDSCPFMTVADVK